MEAELNALTKRAADAQPVSQAKKQKLHDDFIMDTKLHTYGGWYFKILSTINAVKTGRELGLAETFFKEVKKCLEDKENAMKGQNLEALKRACDNARNPDDLARAKKDIGAEVARISNDFEACAKAADEKKEAAWRQ